MKNLHRVAHSSDTARGMTIPAASTISARTDPHRGHAVLLPLAVCFLWCCYSLNGFRGWWQPIALSDADSGSTIRQALFLSSATVIALAVWVSGITWLTIRTHWRLILLAGWLGLTTLYSESPATTGKRAVLFAFGAGAIAGMTCLTRDPVRFAGRVLAFIPATAAWVSLAWWLLFAPEITTNPGRPGLAGTSNHPNTLAPALAIGVIMALGLQPSSRIEHAARILSIVGCALALAMTESMTSIGFAVFGVAVLGVFLLPPYWRAVAGILSAGSLTAILVSGAERISEGLLNSVGRDSSLSGRDELWKEVIARISEAPLFGQGWGAFWLEGRGRELVSTWNPRQSHNAYLDLLLDLGIVGTAICVFTLGPGIWLAFRHWRSTTDPRARRSSAALLAVTAGLLGVYALQQSFLGKVDTFAFFAMLLGIAAATADRANATRRFNFNARET